MSGPILISRVGPGAAACAAVLLVLAFAPAHAESLPAAFNLIQPDPNKPDIICITSVRDQGELGSCWANAATSAFESSILKHGLVERADDPRLDLSCWHLAAHGSCDAPEFSATWDREQQDYDYAKWGGTMEDSIMYWARGRGSWAVSGAPGDYRVGGGPVSMNSHPLNEYPIAAAHEKVDLRPYIPPANQHPAWRLEQSDRLVFDHDGPATAAERDKIKEQLLDTSAVVTDVHTEFSKYFNTQTSTYLYRGGNKTTHEVIIIGWDDTIRVPGAKHRGAWLIQNSYGEGEDESIHYEYRGLPVSDLKGCFWLSYDDTAGAKDNYSVVAAPLDRYSDTVLENQIFNDDRAVGNSVGERDKAISVLSARPPVSLAAVGIANEERSDKVAVRVYDTMENAERDDSQTGLLGSAQASLTNMGYSTIYFDKPVTTSQSKLYVLLDFGVSEKAAIGVDTRSTRKNGVSWYYKDSRWIDLNKNEDAPGTLFLKGITLK